MQFRLMRHFITVAEELHMHRAAERLNMAQPALSQQIKSLETQLGVTLFSRANRRLTLTPAGEAFLTKARLAIAMTEQAVLDARQTARGEQGILNLGCVSSAMFEAKLPAVLRHFHARWPNVTLSMTTGNVQNLYASIQRNDLDVAIVRAPLPALPDDLQSIHFAGEKSILALYSEHPLATSAALTLASLKGEKWIALRDPQGMGLEQYFNDVCAGAGIQPSVVQQASDVPTVVSLVSAGFGIALLPASARTLRVENVVYIDILDRIKESELTLICHRFIRSEVLKKFLTTLAQA
ncbi:TPA: LysR substrate-binding domain-containing protein [Enterobacter cancerogenus]|uniref:LysR family transcriptional regulator n=1 Tax=Enterobacter cancerogenus TaxID=69218 RepID=A0AB38P2B6_9ENTR|nr:LysR substrate-binding domain-containing protein [Enterobacter cancerogenus]KTQ50434.1 LysR family transcriptional regulator [Enterobacter cancerogenus]KTQ54451.1 LysR family transcriptional regulator [Enterobacter cancerogenus]KTQ75806.1 LysR family transcriptional regulator [Enterobacter cancerogenus]KTQ78031.1 LysR family transcriptional regulator [Enterobacter cancerogenus]TKK16320.1 LysR family transcriptional regulator [Enterobacter cancerogenus]